MSGSNSSSNDGLLSSNGSNIKVNSMERFKSDNDELELWISKAVEYASNISKNSFSAIATLGDIDSKLNGLQKVSLSTKWKLTFYDVSVEEYTKRLSENTASSLTKCYSGFKYAELLIEAYNNGGELIPELQQEMEDMKSIYQTIVDANGLWITTSCLEKLSDKIPLLGTFYILSKAYTYGDDVFNEGGDFFVGDNMTSFIQNIFEKTGSKYASKITEKEYSQLFVSATKLGSGTALVALYELLIGSQIRMANDEGDYTYEDSLRNNLQGVESVVTFAEWAAITELCAAAGISSGPAGVIAALVAIPSVMIFDSIIDEITGDKIVSSYSLDENGNVISGDDYNVPANGNGEKGTYDVILSRIKNSNEQNRTRNYDDVYLDWYSYGNYYNGERMNITRDEIIIFDDALDCVRNASTEHEAAMIWDKITHYEMDVNSTYSDSVQHDSIEHVVNYLNCLDENDSKQSFTFDIKEWWKVNKK